MVGWNSYDDDNDDDDSLLLHIIMTIIIATIGQKSNTHIEREWQNAPI